MFYWSEDELPNDKSAPDKTISLEFVNFLYFYF